MSRVILKGLKPEEKTEDTREKKWEKKRKKRGDQKEMGV